MCFVSRESAEGGRVIVEVDDKVATVRNIKVCFLFSSVSQCNDFDVTLFCLFDCWITLKEILRETFKLPQLLICIESCFYFLFVDRECSI